MTDIEKAREVEEVWARFVMAALTEEETCRLLNYVTGYAPEAMSAAINNALCQRSAMAKDDLLDHLHGAELEANMNAEEVEPCAHAGDCAGHVGGPAVCDCRDPACTGQCCGEGVCPCTPVDSTVYPRRSTFEAAQGEWVRRHQL